MPQFEAENTAASKTGVHSERLMRPRVAQVKATFRRASGIRVADLDPAGKERLDQWAALKAKRMALDRAFEAGEEWSRDTYIAFANAERLAFDRLEPHLLALLDRGESDSLAAYLARRRNGDDDA
jgi:hypothetical protein